MQQKIPERCAANLDAAMFARDFLRRNRPVVITGSPELAAPSLRWNLDYLSENHPSAVVTLLHYPAGDRSLLSEYMRMEFSRYLALIRGTVEARQRYFLAANSLSETFPNTAPELAIPAIIGGARVLSRAIFAGVDTFTNAHYHTAPVEAVITQVCGRKDITLYPPGQWRLLNPYPWYSMKFNYCRLPANDWIDTSPQMPPGGCGCVLNPGDMLFIPQGWFHIARGLAENISVTYFFKGRWRDASARMLIRDVASMLQKSLVVTPMIRLARTPQQLRFLLRSAVRLGIISSVELETWAKRLGREPPVEL